MADGNRQWLWIAGAAVAVTAASFFVVRGVLRMSVLKHSPLPYQPKASDVRSPFGERISPITGKLSGHNGVDLRGAIGDNVFAVFDGVVSFDDDDPHGAGGIQVIVTSDDGWRAGYSHLVVNTVDAGERVSAGDIVGGVGATGEVTGPHLHFTLTNPKGQKVDPMLYL